MTYKPILLTVFLALALLAAACSQLDASLTDLEPGDCVADPGTRFQIESLDHVDCGDEDAVLQVSRVFTISGYDEYPGFEVIDRLVDRDCTTDTTAVMHPTQESWERAGDREVVCFRDI